MAEARSERQMVVKTGEIGNLINRKLPASLLLTLERSWYENFNMAEHAVMPLQSQIRTSQMNEEVRFLQVFEVAHNENIAQSLHLYNMQNVISSLRDGSHAIAYAVCSDGQRVRLLIGVRQHQHSQVHFHTHEYVDVLYRALRSNYPGIVLSSEPKKSYEHVPYEVYKTEILDKMLSSQYLAAVTGIPSLRNPGLPNDSFSQSIDRFVDALRGEAFTLLVLAEPISDERLSQIVSRLHLISSEVHNLVSQSKTISQSIGQSKSISDATGQQASLGVGQLVSAIFGISFGMSSTHTEGVSDSVTEGASITQETMDKTALFCEQALEHYIQRVQAGRSLGFWNAGVYLACNELNTYLRAKGITRSLYSGQNTYFEPIRVLDLKNNPDVRKSLAKMRIPVLASMPGSGGGGPRQIDHPLGIEFHGLATPISTDELSLLISFPNREVPGLKLKPVADFNLNPPSAVEGAEIGGLLYRGEVLNHRIAISQKSLIRHTFITGLTGSGKTNTCLALLEDAYRKQGLKFLVIDPAKTEYRFLMNSERLGQDLIVYTLGDESTSPFRLNPFEFVRGFPLLSHIDLVKAVFNAAFPMYASMPYLLEEAILEIYQERGWDISSSSNRFLGDYQKDASIDYTPYLPRLGDLYAKIDTIVAKKRYDVRIAQDLTAALKARLGSLLHGGKGLMLDTQRSIPVELLLNRPVVLELRRAGDDDERAFIMALIFILLYEACQGRAVEDSLKHVTLIEEAHRLLRNLPAATSLESANPRGKAVEMFTDMMAEMRAHGEGFIIVDQVPNKLIPDVIKGSNLKIVHRLMAQDDRLVVGSAMGMTPAQINYLPRLRKGEAIIHSEELEEPCLTLIDSVEDRLAMVEDGYTPEARQENTRLKLQRRSQDFFAGQTSVLHKYFACKLCDAPCTYQPSENQPPEYLVRLGGDYLARVALGSIAECQKIGNRLRVELDRYLAVHFPQAHVIPKGKERCMLIILASQVARNFTEAYAQAGNWDAALRLQEQLARTWENWPNQGGDMNDLRHLLLKSIMVLPNEPRVGCAFCPRRCWFGFLIPTDKRLLAGIAEKFRTSVPNQRVNPQKLSEHIAEHYKGAIVPSFLPFAAYCVYAHCSENDGLLQDFLGRAMEEKHE